jgi:hypothetical protein
MLKGVKGGFKGGLNPAPSTDNKILAFSYVVL